MALDILVVDDEADIRMLVADILQDEGYECRIAGDSRGALQSVEERRPNLVILDIWLRGSELDGLAILEVLKREHPDVPVVMIHDDIVWTSGAFIHPDWYRRFVFPNYKRLFAPLVDSGK